MAEKVERRQRKAALTRIINRIDRLIVEDEKGETLSHMEKMKETFKNFEAAHERYHALLENDDEIEESDEYFFAEERKYIDALQKAKDYVGPPSTKLEENDDAKTRASDVRSYDILKYLNAPKIELEKFDGDPMKYHTFMAMIEETVDPLLCADKMKLTRLMQYTEGKAKEAIQFCLLLDGEAGYEKAKSILQERFGNQELVKEQIVKNLRGGKQSRSPQEIQCLSDELESAYAILKQMDKLKEIDCQSLILEVVRRLPFYMQNKWSHHAVDVKRSKRRYPDFGELMEFVKTESEVINDPVYSQLNTRRGDVKKPQHQTSSHSFSTRMQEHPAQSRKPPCLLCKDDHRLLYCPSFKAMNLKDRLQLVENKKLCENCLLSNHVTSNCRKPSVCSVTGCGKKHTKFLHVSNDNVYNVSVRSGQTDVKVANASSTGVHVYMPIVAVQVNGQYATSALLDTASSSTFCTRSIVNSLGLRGRPSSFMLNTLNASKSQESMVVSIDITSLDHAESLKLNNVYVVDKIPVNIPVIDTHSYRHLEGLKFADVHNEVGILIGQDNAEALVPLETRRGYANEPFAVRTILGWTLNGPGNATQKVKQNVINHFISAGESIENKIEALWNVENEGLSNDECAWSQEDAKVIQLWDDKCVLVDGHYQIPIPWKDDVIMPNNISLALARIRSTKMNLLKRGLWSRYNEEMANLFSSGYAELVPVDEIDNADKIWYLPHQPVLNDKKPDKMRIVFDCASKWGGESLNDKCMRGPDLINKLLFVLLRFRQHKYAVMADVEAMYHQVLIPTADRNALRFLWFDENGHIIHCRMTRHIFGGVWCSASSAYAIRRVASDSNNVDPLIASTILNAFYVDDCLKSVSSEREALTVIRGTKGVLEKAGFRLHKFVVNDDGILNSISEPDRAKEVKDLGSKVSSKALGVQWCIDDDMFFFEINIECHSDITRRKVLSIVSSIFDPLGLVNPVIITGKIVMQDATRLKLAWDETLPDELKTKWYDWLQAVRRLVNLRIPRCIKPTSFDDSLIQLHHFSDASQRAYGCCTYVRCVNKHGEIHTALVTSKAKVAPLKPLTIPRLELQAAVLASQVDAMLKREFEIQINESYFWVDSELVLKYIKNETRRFSVFVGNRISTLRSLSNPSQWGFIPGSENPADLLTRGQDPATMDVQKWCRGPDFLRTYKNEWEAQKCDVKLPLDDPEVRPECHVKSRTCYVTSSPDHPFDKLINKHSNWYILKRAVAWLLRLKAKLRRRQVGTGLLTVEEIQQAELTILKYVQQKHYGKVIQQCFEGGVCKSSDLKSLNPVLDNDGLLRVGGRIKHAVVDCCKQPYIVPHHSPIAVLIAREKHEISHSGVEWVVSLIRKRFWLTKIRVVVKQISRNCLKCKRLFSSPSLQKMADLPLERIDAFKPAFCHSGVDCFGPLIVKQGRANVKRYGCIFSCLTTRAVHIEKLNSLDTDAFINCFRRFTARRGLPETIISDQGTNFTGANSELSKSLRQLNHDQIFQFAVRVGVQWKFNPPGASHMGGAWERLIRTVRKVMAGIVPSNASLSDDGLDTLFCEIEAIVNSRPLTKVSDDINDSSPLTPNHLLLLRDCPSFPPGSFCEDDRYKRKWRCVQQIANEFWHKWLREYLPDLQKRVKWHQLMRNLKIGDLVLITQENTPRGLWPIGIVTNVNEGKDGLVRSVEIKTKSTKLVRPITKVVLLEAAV